MNDFGLLIVDFGLMLEAGFARIFKLIYYVG